MNLVFYKVYQERGGRKGRWKKPYSLEIRMG
jgi:hypothetical protein